MYQFTTKNTKLQRSYYNTKLKQPQGISESNLIKNSIYYKNRCSSVVVNNRNVNSFKTYNNYKQQYNNLTISCKEISKYTEIYGDAKTKNEIYCNLPPISISMINFCIHKKNTLYLTYDVIRSIINNNFLSDTHKNHLLDTIPLSNPFIGKGGSINSMLELFKDAGSGINPNISYWNVSNITNMSSMFKNATGFNTDISNWIVSNVSNMESMFAGASNFNANISNWNVSKVTNMSSMFADAYNFNNGFSRGISNDLIWNVSSVTNMEYMFFGVSGFNANISNWIVSNVTNMSNMFSGANSFNANISSWNVSNVTNMSNMFAGAINFNANISNWNVSKVTNMSAMFNFAMIFNNGLSRDNSNDLSWNVSNVTNMLSMFDSAYNFNANISNWNVSKVTNMSGMFSDATIFNNGLSRGMSNDLSWNVSNVTNMGYMFDSAYNFNANISNWNVSNVTNMSSMFRDAYNFNANISNWNVSNVTNMSSMFIDAHNFNANISNWNVSNVTNMSSMFNNASSFNQDLSWNLSNVTNMSNMFNGSGITNPYSNGVNKNLIYTRWFNHISNNVVTKLSNKKIFNMLEDSGLIEEKLFEIQLKHGFNNIYLNGYFKSNSNKNILFANPLNIPLDNLHYIFEDADNIHNVMFIGDQFAFAEYNMEIKKLVGSLSSINNYTSYYIINNSNSNINIKYYGYDLMYPFKFGIYEGFNLIGNPYNFNISIRNFNSYINNDILDNSSLLVKPTNPINDKDDIILGIYNLDKKKFDICSNIVTIEQNEGFKFYSSVSDIMSFNYQ